MKLLNFTAEAWVALYNKEMKHRQRHRNTLTSALRYTIDEFAHHTSYRLALPVASYFTIDAAMQPPAGTTPLGIIVAGIGGAAAPVIARTLGNRSRLAGLKLVALESAAIFSTMCGSYKAAQELFPSVPLIASPTQAYKIAL